MRFLFCILLLGLTQALSCCCCMDGHLVEVENRCDIRLNQVPARGRNCANVTTQTSTLMEQMAIIEAEIARLTEDIAVLESEGIFGAARNIASMLTELRIQEDDIDRLLASAGDIGICTAAFIYEDTAISGADSSCSPGTCADITLLNRGANVVCSSGQISNSPFTILIETDGANIQLNGVLTVNSPRSLQLVLFQVNGATLSQTQIPLGTIIPDEPFLFDMFLPSPGPNTLYEIDLSDSTHSVGTVVVNGEITFTTV